MNRGNLKYGALTFDELMHVWSTVAVDEQTYAKPLLELGYGYGLEFHTQLFVQLARASEAVNRTTQACYILPHSAQSGEPASGEAYATVLLTFTRTTCTEPLTLLPNHVWFDEVQSTSGENGPVPIITGRRYTLVKPLVMHPGELGPITALAIAERAGYGWNNPLPGTINLFENPGAVLTNYGALTMVGGNATLTLSVNPDVLTPDQVGQYIEFLNGANIGVKARVVAYTPPVVNVHGGIVTLEQLHSAQGTVASGTFIETGEPLILLNAALTQVGMGAQVGARKGADGVTRVSYTLVSGSIAPVGGRIVGASSGAVLNISLVTYNSPIVAQSVAQWKVALWDFDIGVSVTNTKSPEGGRSDMLDLIGNERKVYRAPNESDDAYRLRVAQVADVVSPHAILRGVNGILAPLGVGGVLREVGTEDFPGFFYDAGASTDIVQKPQHNFAYDANPTLRPADLWKVYLSFAEMRAFFLVGVPRIPGTDAGMPYDGGVLDLHQVLNPYDGNGIGVRNFYDVGVNNSAAATIYRAIWNEVDARRAGGVSFDLYLTS